MSYMSSCFTKRKIAKAVAVVFTVGTTALYTLAVVKNNSEYSLAEIYAIGIGAGLAIFGLCIARTAYRFFDLMGCLDEPPQGSRGAYSGHLGLAARPSCSARFKQMDWFAVFCCSCRSAPPRAVPSGGYPVARVAVVVAPASDDWTRAAGYQVPQVVSTSASAGQGQGRAGAKAKLIASQGSQVGYGAL